MAPTLEVAYDDVAALLHDFETQLALGGLFVGGVDASALPPLCPLTLRLVVADGAGAPPLCAAARLTVATGDAACVELLADARAALAVAVAALAAGVVARAGVRRARLGEFDADAQLSAATVGSDDPPIHDASAQLSDSPSEAAPAAPDSRGAIPLERRIALMSVAEKVQLALHGNREARALLMRDRAGLVQSSLVRNPKMTLDELQALARAPQLSPETAEVLAQHPSHGSSAQLAIALVRNPRTPLPTARALLSRLLPADLRSVAKGVGVRTQVAAAARKLLLDER